MQERPDKKPKISIVLKLWLYHFLPSLSVSSWPQLEKRQTTTDSFVFVFIWLTTLTLGLFHVYLHLERGFFPTIQFSTFFTRAALSGCFDFMWEAIPELEAFLEVQPTFPLLTSFWQWRHQTSRKSPKCFNRFIFTLAHNLKIYLQLFQNETTTNYEVFLFPAS